MTCQDCIHYKSIGTLCDKYIYPEERNNEPCKHFEERTCDNCRYTISGKWPCVDCIVYCHDRWEPPIK